MQELAMTEKEFEEICWSEEATNFDGTVWEFLGMTMEEYRNNIHCRYCKKISGQRKNCEPYNPYCCTTL
jgi:hypothetical protein